MAENVVDTTVKDGVLEVESNGSAAPFVVSVEDGVCTVAVLATNGKPIATVNVTDKETGEATPVNISTCAEAVVCNQGIPMQIHLQNLYEHAEDDSAHLSAEEKASLETTDGAQKKANSAKTAAISAASLMVENAQAAAARDATSKAESARDAAYRYADATAKPLCEHAENTTNPHRVTAEQVGLGNVPNKATNDVQPTYQEAAELEPLKSGERLAAAFGKIAKAISSLISHISNKANPHGVTHTQVGAAAASHSHDAEDIKTGVIASDRLPTIPMMVDEEYATTERFMGKIVYVKLVSFGNLPSNGTRSVAHNAAATQIIRACGQASNGMAFPIGTGGNGFYYIGLRAGLKYVEIYTDTGDYANHTATVQLWYTKD